MRANNSRVLSVVDHESPSTDSVVIAIPVGRGIEGPAMTSIPEYAYPDRPADTLSVRSPSAMLASIPYLVGFPPRNSLVLLMLAPPRGRIKLTMRVDLPDNEGPLIATALASGLAARVCHVGAESAIAVLFNDEAGSAGTADVDRFPHAHLVDALVSELGVFGVELVDAMLVSQGRRWSYLCDNPYCCPAEGVLIGDEESEAVQARLVMEGLAPASSREEVVARIAPDARGEQLVAHVLGTIDESDHVGWGPIDFYRLTALVIEESNWARYSGSGEPDTSFVPEEMREFRHAHIAQLLYLLQSIWIRDLVIRRVILDGASSRSARPLCDALCDVLRWAPVGYVAPIATITALVSWQAGDGLIAVEALTRALDDNPDYYMAKLTMDAIDGGLPPARMLEVFEKMTEEDCLGGRTVVEVDPTPRKGQSAED